MHENWKIKSHDSAILYKIFADTDGIDVLSEVALTDISANPNIDLDELARDALKKRHQERVEKYRFTGSHFEPIEIGR